MSHTEYRLPAEWERQSATLLAWPPAASDWAGQLDAIRDEYVHLVRAITRYQPVALLTPPGDDSAHQALGDRPGLHYIKVPYNDTWCRDYGPVTLVHTGQRLALDFHFDGWGGKFDARLDNRVNTHLARHELFDRLTFRQYLFGLEGGAIDTDGRGNLLVNWHCLEARHPHMSRNELDYELHSLLNVDKVLGIDLPPMPGDDTDGHIDTLARFIGPRHVVFQAQRDAQRAHRLREQLEALNAADGPSLEFTALPAPDDLDAALPASYVNFLFVNEGLLVPAFGSARDDEAAAILTRIVTDRRVSQVPARVMITQSGGPHCASMQIPAALG